MKYVTVPNFELISDALNFENDGYRVEGGCDLFTTKAPISDKKLMAKIDNNLQSKYKELITLAASLSPPEATLFARKENLSRSSPFGTLSESANRRVFAYLVATMNANWRDYDFSNILTPDDFTVVKLYHAQQQIEDKIYGAHSQQCLKNLGKYGGGYTPGGSTIWRPQMWGMISEEMTLSECTVYRLSAAENPFDEGPELWSFHYFFYNKNMKRVCYLYARCADIPVYGLTEPTTPTPRRIREAPDADYDFDSDAFGADKRAKYWLGKHATSVETYTGSYASTADGLRGLDDERADREADRSAVLDTIRNGRSSTPISISSDSEDDDVQMFASRVKTPSKPAQKNRQSGATASDQSPADSQKEVRSMSVSIVESMEV